jgi:hypothetical protein
MGLDMEKIPAIKSGFDCHALTLTSCPADKIRISDFNTGKTISLSEITPALGKPFDPAVGWKPVIKKQ